MVLEAKEVIWCNFKRTKVGRRESGPVSGVSVQRWGEKRAAGRNAFRWGASFMERKHRYDGCDQSDVVRVAAGLLSGRLEKQTGLRRKTVFPLEVTTEHAGKKKEERTSGIWRHVTIHAIGRGYDREAELTLLSSNVSLSRTGARCKFGRELERFDATGV